MEALKAAQLKAGHRLNTRKCYQHWLGRYLAGAQAGQFHDLQGFLDHLAVTEALNPKTVKQALNAMVFFYRKVLERDPGKLQTPRVNPNRNLPTWLHHEEAMDLLGRMRGTAKLQAGLLYGTGARVNAMLTLRLKDLDLRAGVVSFRHDKGGKSRAVRLPRVLLPALEERVEWLRGRWEEDHRAGVIAPCEDAALMRKLGRATFGSLPWYWLFPSQVVREGQRWHATDRGLCKAIAVACRAAGMTKRVTAHTFRHSNATALLERGENIRAIQEHLGHTHVETTEIYTHARADGGLRSPMDGVNAEVVVPFERRLAG